MTSNIWKVRALKASRPENPDPIKMQAGDLLELIGKEDRDGSGAGIVQAKRVGCR